MRSLIFKRLRAWVESPVLNVIVGMILLYSGISETYYEFRDVDDIRIGVHHGIIVFALFKIIKTVPDLFEGIERLIRRIES